MNPVLLLLFLTLDPGSDNTKFYPLPQSTVQDHIRLRPEDLKRNPAAAGEL